MYPIRSLELSFAAEFCPALARTLFPFTSALLCKLSTKRSLTNLRFGHKTFAPRFTVENLPKYAESVTIRASRMS